MEALTVHQSQKASVRFAAFVSESQPRAELPRAAADDGIWKYIFKYFYCAAFTLVPTLQSHATHPAVKFGNKILQLLLGTNTFSQVFFLWFPCCAAPRHTDTGGI